MAITLSHHKHTAARVKSRLRRQVRGRKKVVRHRRAPAPGRHPVVEAHHRPGGRRPRRQDAGLGQHHGAATCARFDGDKSAKAKKVGELVAERAKAAGVEGVVFDRAGNKYHGRVAALADGAREGGLTF